MQNSLMIGWHHRCEIGEQEVVAAQKDLEDSINQGSVVILDIFPVVSGIFRRVFQVY